MQGSDKIPGALSLRKALLDYLKVERDRRFHFIWVNLGVRLRRPIQKMDLAEQLWLLVSQGLAFTDMQESSHENWMWHLSDLGRKAAESECEFDPHDPEGYLKRLQSKVANLDPSVLMYSREALTAFNSACYLATSVMLGVASEKAFLLLAEAFGGWLPESEGSNLRRKLDNQRASFSDKFDEFRKKAEPRRKEFPEEFAENMSLNIDAVCDLIRVYRNEAGHPTGKRVDRDDAYVNLQMFARYIQKVFGLITFFQTNHTQGQLAEG